MLTIGGRVNGFRRSAGWTQRQLAKRIGVAQSTISEVERDAGTPEMDTLRKLAGAFNISVSELLAGAE